MDLIPKQLQNNEFRFLLLRPKGKEPIGSMKNWQETNCQWDNPVLEYHLKEGGNYGIIGGYGNLILIDVDSEEINNLCSYLPNTFTIKTGSLEEYKHHYYFISDTPIKPIRLSKEKLGDLGDIRSVGQYVVAPNSIHPSGKEYKIIKDVPIAKISENFIRSIFKEYIDKNEGTELKDKSSFPIDTKKRDSPFIKNCNVPDYVLNNPMKKNTSKNWKLFPYIIDILNARQVSSTLYERLAKIQEHDLGAVKGWVIKAKEGKLAKTSCQKMRNYLDRFHPELKEKICGECKLYKKLKKEEEKEEKRKSEVIDKAIKYFSDKRNLAKQFLEIQPLFYDKNKIWWVWDKECFKWEIIDDVDILNSISNVSSADTINSKEKNEILESLKQISRLNKPKEIPECWVQFKNKIYDIETEEEINASSTFFVTNPIGWKLGESEETQIIDCLFESWVGKEHKEELYEVLAFCLIPNYFIHRIICFIGSGANGKSTFMKILRKFIGDENICSTSLDLLMKTRFEGAKLLKKLVCIMGETNFNTIKKTDFIKKLSGEDVVGGEMKGKNPFDFKNYAKLIMATNSLPMTEDKTEGFYRRWKIIDFKNKFEIEKDVLSEISDEEYNNLALKCFNIAKRLWEERIFTNDGNFEERKQKYEEKSNPMIKFLENNYIRDINGDVLFSEFFELLNDFLDNGGYRKLTIPSVSKQLKEEGFDIKTKTIKGNTAKYIIGLNITNNPNNPNNPKSVLDYI